MTYEVKPTAKPEAPAAPVVAPVKTVWRPWVRLRAKAQPDGAVQLHWQTDDRQVKRIFLIERSMDGLLWDQLAQINSTDVVAKKKGYEYLDSQPITGASYRLFCLVGDTTKLHSEVLAVFGAQQTARFGMQPIRYYTIQQSGISLGLEPNYVRFPLTANVYSPTGRLLCYETLTKLTDEFVVEWPTTSDASVKLQLTDGMHRVLTILPVARLQK